MSQVFIWYLLAYFMMKSIRSRSKPIHKISATDVFPSTSKLRDLFPSLLPGFLYSFREWRYEIKAYFVIVLAMFTEFWLSFIKGKFSQENQRKTSFSFKSSAVRIQCVVRCTLAALAARAEWVSELFRVEETMKGQTCQYSTTIRYIMYPSMRLFMSIHSLK